MLAVDTNVLLRLMLNDDPKQAAKARAFCAQAQDSGERLFVPQVVVHELVWVLDAVKKIPRAEIVRVVDGLLNMPLWDIEEPHRIAGALRYFRDFGVDFTDAALAAMVGEKKLDGVLSFDRDMQKLGVAWARP